MFATRTSPEEVPASSPRAEPAAASATAASPRVRVRYFVGRARGASGAVGAQLAQALTSLVLSIAAARSLGADGLGVYGLIFGGLIFATAITTGLVGDSLTVLDRGVRHLRAGLQIVGLWCAVLTAVAGTIVCGATGLLSWPLSFVFGIAAAVFIVEDFLRRLLMASLRFGSVMAVDISCLVATIAWLLAARAVGPLNMLQILLALLISQLVGITTAVALLPPSERQLAPWREGDVRSVIRFGGWRAAQQAVRPAMLTGMRVLTVVAAGTIAFGQLEAARVYTAPTLLIVVGIGGFLFATFAAKKDRPISQLVREADGGALAMFASVIVAGGAAAALLPWAGGIVTGSQFTIDKTAVLGWVLYSAAAGFLMPYGSLAAVRGLHVKVFTLRLLESVVSLAAVVFVLFVVDASPSWVPAAMAIGPAVLGAIIRQHVLSSGADGRDEISVEYSTAAQTASM